jgi:hypothetical protein
MAMANEYYPSSILIPGGPGPWMSDKIIKPPVSHITSQAPYCATACITTLLHIMQHEI